MNDIDTAAIRASVDNKVGSVEAEAIRTLCDALDAARADMHEALNHIAATEERLGEMMAENARMTKALKFAGDYLEASEKNGLPDLGDASNMPFIADVIEMIDAALAREGEGDAE